ncbi:polymer-forming cytoskeletal protein [Sphingomonas parva]|uniref:Polymer-forming cytoskeletal protein n=1 Tax=Sphingomonas parva TaxID=2555898 RepID=A0A4Y8ZQG5_9SPHN|nr:polymer-forming cytoskeletal protein [Sphingomonas parva]TFI57385.1 polymer-forming cytoskeletal protein [Sphingomonas parva]
MFSRSARQPERPGSTIAADAVFTGNITTAGRLHIDGAVHGDVRCGELSQGAGGAVHGNIVAEAARLAGLVDGAVEAGTLALEASARITGDVLYESLGIAPGAEVEGRFRRRKGPADHGACSARAEAVRAASAGTEAAETVADPAVAAPRAPAERTPRRAARTAAKGPELFPVPAELHPDAEAAE